MSRLFIILFYGLRRGAFGGTGVTDMASRDGEATLPGEADPYESESIVEASADEFE